MRYRAKIISRHLGGTIVIESEVDAGDEKEARAQIEAAALFSCNYAVRPDDRVVVAGA